MKLTGELVQALFLERINRFTLKAKVEEEEAECFLPNPGRLKEILIPGRTLLLRQVKGKRKTGFDVAGVLLDDEWVTIDSRIPNALIKEALEKESIPEFHGFRLLRSEPTFGKARLDFLLHPPCLVEVKGCTLVRNSVALFPDAPTDRGTRHLMELAKAVSEGYRACILFVVQRSGATALVPNQETDPKFSLALREAMEKGVEALAYRSCYRKGEIVLGGRVDVRV